MNRLIWTAMASLSMVGCGEGSKTDEATQTDVATSSATDIATDDATDDATQAAVDDAVPTSTGTIVVLETELGDVRLSLDADRAPKAVANFLDYMDDGYYNNTQFHRIIADTLIQGGGIASDGSEKATRDPVANESDNGLLNRRGTLAAARRGNFPNSATSQFFINAVDNPQYDDAADTTPKNGYTVFGIVLEGLDVVDAISRSAVNADGDPTDPTLLVRAYRP